MTDVLRAKEVLAIEATAISHMHDRLGDEFDAAIKILKDVKGRIILTGMGKPGFIARKIAATMASTGSPAYYVHPAEAIHGDLGMIVKNDVVVAISHSGETEEIVRLLSLIKRRGCELIGLTGNLTSTLAKNSDCVLDVSVAKEACPMGLAPTASSTAALAMGDALAIVLYESKGFRAEDYAQLHPGGSLGQKLLLRVSDCMRSLKETPCATSDQTLKDAATLITKLKAGAVIVVDEQNVLQGIVTDGDLRRSLIGNDSIEEKTVLDIMTRDAMTVESDDLAVEVLRVMQEKKIDEVPVVNEDRSVVGLLDLQDLLKVGLV